MPPKKVEKKKKAKVVFQTRPDQQSVNFMQLADPRSASYKRLSRDLNLPVTAQGADRPVAYFDRDVTRMRVVVRRIQGPSMSEIVEGNELVASSRRPFRYFTLTMNARAGQTLGDLRDEIEDEIVGNINALEKAHPGSNWRDDDEGAENYDILRIDDMQYAPGGRRNVRPGVNTRTAERTFFDGLDDEDEPEDSEDYLASHQFQAVPLEDLAIKKLVLRDFTCIYESLMIIRYYHLNDRAPDLDLVDWKEHVLLFFSSETFETQQLFYDQQVMQGIRIFEERYKIKIGLFDAHRFQSEAAKIQELASMGVEIPNFFIIYWGEHVFPCLRDNIDQICHFQQTALDKMDVPYDRLFMIMPPLINFLYKEIQCAYVGVGRLPLTDEYVFEALPGIRVIDILVTGGSLKTRMALSLDKQKQAHLEYQLAEGLSAEVIRDIYLEKMGPYLRKTKAEKLIESKDIAQMRACSLYYTPTEYDHYKELLVYEEKTLEEFEIVPEDQMVDQEEIDAKKNFQLGLRAQNRVLEFSRHRGERHDDYGIAVIDMETYMDNRLDSGSLYNMVPFCISLVGDLQRMTTEMVETERTNGHQQIRYRQKVDLVRGVNEIFMGFSRREAVQKLIRYLIENNYCYTQTDFTQMFSQTRDTDRRCLSNYIFAHNGFGFDFKFLLEELNIHMREFVMVGDSSSTKHIHGNGLFFFDFALIYRLKLKVLAKTFFPNQPELWKKDCDLIIDLPMDTVRQWYVECSDQGIVPEQHSKLGEIIEYCRRDSQVLFAMVKQFFRTTYTTPYGHGFLPKPFYHSLSSLAYNMFIHCYLRQPIFVNKHSLEIEQATKRGGYTGAQSNVFGIGIFIDANSMYPSMMFNDMPVRYKITATDPYVTLPRPIELSNEEDAFMLSSINIYRCQFKFPADACLPTIAIKSKDTLICVQETVDYDLFEPGMTAVDVETVLLFGCELIAALHSVPGTKIRIFGMVEFHTGDAIFREFIEDQYKLRMECRARGDEVGSTFHKNVMNSAQGKLGQKIYPHIKFGSSTVVQDMYRQLRQQDNILEIEIRQLLTDQVDLFEIRWQTKDDRYVAPGNTVRLPSYIMALSRSYLLSVENTLAAHFMSADVIGYQDTDSILNRLDLHEKELNEEIQLLFDDYLEIMNSKTVKDNCIVRAFHLGFIQPAIAVLIGDKISACSSVQAMRQITFGDIRYLDQPKEVLLLDENRLGAFKIEKYVIRGLAHGGKQYGVYYIEMEGGKWMLKIAVKIKGVRAEARSMDILEKIHSNICIDMSTVGRADAAELPIALTQLMTKWSRMGAGVMLSKMVKVVRPTLTKRIHNLKDGTSMPFKDLRVFQAAKNDYECKNKIMKDVFRSSVDQIVEDIYNHPDSIKVRTATRTHNQLQRDTKENMKQSRLMLREGRKRYLMRLRKLKFNQLQDRVFEFFLSDHSIDELAMQYLPKVHSIAMQAMIIKNSTTRKGCVHADGSRLTREQGARIITYILFIMFVLKDVKKVRDIPDNFKEIAFHLSNAMIRSTLFNEKVGTNNIPMEGSAAIPRGTNVNKWNYALVYGFEFLQAGVCIQKNIFPEQRIDQSFNAELTAPLSSHLQYSNLWRYLSNLHDQLVTVASLGSGEGGVIDTSLVDQSIKRTMAIDTSLLVGEEDQQCLFLNDTMDCYERIQDSSSVLGKRKEPWGREEAADTHSLVPREVCVMLQNRPVINSERALLDQIDKFNDGLIEKLDQRLSKSLFMNSIIEQHQGVQVNNTVKLNSVFDALKEIYGEGTLSQSFIQELFGFALKKSSNGKSSQKDLQDLVIFFLFLLEGGRDAAILLKALHADIGCLYKKAPSHSLIFSRVCSIVFCRPTMFAAFDQQRLSQKTRDILHELMRLSVYFDHEGCSTEDKFQGLLSDIMNDRHRMPPKLIDLYSQIKQHPKLRELGKYLYRQILIWRKPSVAMVTVLKSIILLDADIWADKKEDVQRLWQAELQEIQEFKNEYQRDFQMVHMEKAFAQQQIMKSELLNVKELTIFDDWNNRDPLMYRGNEDDDDMLFNDDDLFGKEGDVFFEDVNDDVYCQEDRAAVERAYEKAAALGQFEDNTYEQFFKRTDDIREEDLDMVDEVDSNYGADQPAEKKNKFFEMEAEEENSDVTVSDDDDDDESMPMMICTSVVHNGKDNCCCSRR